MYQLFFGNSTEDQSHIDNLIIKLNDLLPNLPINDLSKNVPYQDDWQTYAEAMLQKCLLFVCVVGKNTHSSSPIDWELREAHRLNKPIVVARLSPQHLLPLSCEELQIPAIDWNTDEVAGIIGEHLVSSALFLHHDWKNSDTEYNTLWNQYNLMVQSWESLIERRQTVNTLYISASAALLAGIGVMVSSIDKTGIVTSASGVALFSFLGMILSYNWRRTIMSYGILSRAKSKVVAALEAYMPAKLFDAEWKVLEAKQYKSTTETDKQTILFFMLLFLTLTALAVGFVIGSFIL